MLKVAVLADFVEEDWPSMDLCAEMLVAGSESACQFSRICPPFRRLFSKVPWLSRQRLAFNFDRLTNRFLHYPRFASRLARSCDAFHVVDHSYAQLVHVLPAERTGVYCHDLDAFRSLLEPHSEPRPWWFRQLAKRQLMGLQKAAVVFFSTLTLRDALLKYRLIDPARLVHAPYGVSTEFNIDAETPCPDWLRRLDGAPWVAHVGSCITRKRVDVLLSVLAAARTVDPNLKLVKIGGQWPPEQSRQIERLGLSLSIIHRHGLTRGELAHVYRHASAVLVTSDSEGFGLPVIEALACGAIVLASDLPVLRETGGEAALFAPVADVQAWKETLAAIVAGRANLMDLPTRLRWASKFTWRQHVATIREAYQRLGNREEGRATRDS